MRPTRFAALILFGLPLAADEDRPDHTSHIGCEHGIHRHAIYVDGLPSNWLTGANVDLGGVLFPHLHALGAFGGSTADSIESLAVGHHDPQATSTLQGLEPGLSLRAGDYLEGFATYSLATDAAGDLDGFWEEAFLKVKSLPGNMEIRGGRFLNRFGFQNASHNHSWNFVNQNLLNGRILQEGELITDGGELTWILPTPFVSSLSLSYGHVPTHGDHGHAEHGGHEEGEHGDEFEFEDARFSKDIYGANYTLQFEPDEFRRHRAVFSGAWGRNAFGRNTQIYGIGYEYLWRRNGHEPAGSYFLWRNEIAYRHFGAVAEHEEEHGGGHHGEESGHHGDESDRRSFDEAGVYSMVTYGFNERVETGFRIGYVGGIDSEGVDERWRLSPNMTFSLNPERTIFLRLQYDYDHSSGFGSEHSGWAQVGFNWGGAEVR